MSAADYIKEEWKRDELIEFLKLNNWHQLAEATQARSADTIVIYRKDDMYYFPEQVK